MLIETLNTATAIGVIISLVIPFLSSLLAKAHWDGFVTGMITLLLATVNGFFVSWQNAGEHFDLKLGIGAAVTSYIIAIFSRLGLLKNTRMDAKLLAVGSKSPAPVV